MIVSIILGALILILFELNKTKNRKDFSYLKFISKNWIPFTLNILIGLSLVWSKEDIELLQILTINKWTCVMIGFAGQSLFKKLSSLFDKDIETHIGINKSSK